MLGQSRFKRRGFLGLTIAAGSLGLAGVAEAAPASGPRPPAAIDRHGFVIRNAYVMTMDPQLGDIPNGDVLVKDGTIAGVGTNLNAGNAKSVDGRGMVVLPGLVETHWHMWTSLFRSLSGDVAERGYFPISRQLGQKYTPEDMYRGVMLSAAEAIHSGITYVHDWCHNVHGPEHARANIRALRESGLRGRFSYGKPNWTPIEESIDLADLERLHQEWEQHSAGGMLQLGVAWTGKASFGQPRPPDVYRAEVETARRLGLPLTVHLFAGGVSDVARENLLSQGSQVVHAVGASAEEVDALRAAGASLSLSPFTELRVGFGLPRVSDFTSRGIPVGLSIDTTALGGNTDMFSIMKLLQNVENALQQNEFALPARRVLEMATIEGARSMGMDNVIGSLTPGKRADLIMVRTGDLNMQPVTDIAHLVVEAAQPVNVDMVAIDGKVVKWNGRLTTLDVDKIIRDAAQSSERIRREANI